MRCPLCGKQMTPMKEKEVGDSSSEFPGKNEVLYYCGQHGVMNKLTDLKEKADQIAERA